MPVSATAERKRVRTLVWIISLATVGLMFDGYDLVIYGTVVSTFLRDPSHIGAVDPALAGALGSYALIGVLVGALIAGSIGDFLGRRKMMLGAYAWFSLGMLATSFTHTAQAFGIFRFLTGLGVGVLLATTAALVSEFAPKGRKNLCNAITYSGVPLGSLAAAAIAIVLLEHIGWRGLFAIGALPLVTLLPLAIWKMPESVVWLVSRGRIDEARAVAERTGVEMPTLDAAAEAEEQGAAGYAGLFGDFLLPTILIGLMSATGLLLVYSLNTWLPELMLRAGFNAKGSLSFLLVLNGAAALGPIVVARFADRFGPKPVVAASFLLGAVSIAALTLKLPLAALLGIVALVGIGTSGTQTLIYGFVATYFPTRVRGASVAWCAGFGRLGGVGGPLIGGLLIAAGFSIETILLILAGLALVGMVLAQLIPPTRLTPEARPPLAA
ncbi:AAHS family benzoate transporter-like MFS transporter [Amaricoccus macauensis]|uniref:AAHS family benzoate transporter-like MFS transporter n=1 Tax=Amaricoccus macauensis TaxID=57001 RepID=A0A840SSY5_9RHOB|nr:MFS transporter [Amaricoccus macauensis]MBB5222311.1 AAHS family benzoate transporter-like MFS transporter [Amaricoccus macauensis]